MIPSVLQSAPILAETGPLIIGATAVVSLKELRRCVYLGLQAFSQGQWADVPPAGLGVLVCNLGEVAELITNGYLLATPHRVLSSSSPRLSVPYFCNPCLEATVEPLALPPSLPWDREESYDAERHWRRPRNAMLADYGANAFKSLARSHPAVFARHHPDLRVLEDGRVVRVDE